MSASDDDAEPRSSISTRGEAPVVLWVLAVLAMAAALVSRGLEPALPGVWVGADHVITAVKLGAALGSQLVAVGSAVVVVGLVLVTVRSTLPAYLRAYVVGAGVLVVLAVMIASAVKLPHVSRLVVAGAAVLLVLVATRLSARIFTHRAASLILATMALAGLARILAIVFSTLTAPDSSWVLLAAVRSSATLSALLEVMGVVVALVWLVSQPGAAQLRSSWLRWSLPALLLVATSVVLYVVHRGQDPEATGASVLVARAVRELLTTPAPYTPEVVRGFVEILTWMVLLAMLIFNPRGRMMSAAVALALVARGSLEVPLSAALLVIGALALANHPGPDLRTESDG